MRTLTFLALLALPTPLVAQNENKDEEFPPITPADLKRESVEYGADVEPIFRNKCFVCHSGNVTEGDFNMTTYENVLKGGKKQGKKVVTPGKSDQSYLYLACSRQVRRFMPPKTEVQLTPEEVAMIKLWIDTGAKAPTTTSAKVKVVVNLPPVLVKPVRAVAVSPDGKVVAASRGNQVHIYEFIKTPADPEKKTKETEEWEYVRTLFDPQLKTPDGNDAKAAHISLVESMAFSPDGKLLATGSFQEVTIWDIAKGEPKLRIDGFAERVCALDFSPDGKLLATGGGAPTEDGEIKVFTVADGKLFTDIKNGHSDTVFSVAFSPDGKLLATGAADKFLKVFALPSKAGEEAKLDKAFEGHTHHVMGVGWTGDGKKLASASADEFVKVWDYEKGEKIRDLRGHQKQVTNLFFVGKTSQFLTASGDKNVRMWNADNGGTIRNFSGAEDYVYDVSASTDGSIVASGCEDGIVRVYNGKNGQLMKAAIPPNAEPKKDEKK